MLTDIPDKIRKGMAAVSILGLGRVGLAIHEVLAADLRSKTILLRSTGVPGTMEAIVRC